MAKQEERNPRNLTNDEINLLYGLTPDDITKSLLIKYFANTKKNNAVFIPQDRFILDKEVINRFAGNNITKQDVHTTVGRYFFNLFIIFPNQKILNHLNYINKHLDEGGILGILNECTKLILDDVITTEEFYDIENRLHWFGFSTSAFINPGLNYDIIKPQKNVIKRRDELYKQHEEAIANGDTVVITAIEKELVNLAKDTLKNSNNLAYDLYDSGAGPNMGNNYKNMNIMEGPTINNSEGGIRFSKNSLMEGIEKEDISAHGDSLITGVYSRAVGTRTGGYEGKKIMAAFQTLQLDKPGTDCGTDKCLKIFLTKKNIGFFHYRYTKSGELITPETESRYIDRYVDIRSPLYCKTRCFCNKCAGELYYKIGVQNIGSTCNKISSTSLNSALKQFHDSTIKTVSFNYEDYFY